MKHLSQIETFDRGWYAGTIGIISEELIDFCVSIRSALWQAGQLWVWTGAGIVPASTPEQEWQEIHNKAQQFFIRSEP